MEQAEQDLRLYSIADFDLQWCQRYLVAYIELLTPPAGEEEDHWIELRSREFAGDFNFIDILARSLGQAIVNSYSRPWSRNRSQGSGTLPRSIFGDMAKLFRRDSQQESLLSFDTTIHKRMLRLRKKVVAHSDHDQWSFEFKVLPHGTETRMSDPFPYFTLEDARSLLTNTESLRSELDARKRKAIASIRDADERPQNA